MTRAKINEIENKKRVNKIQELILSGSPKAGGK